MADKLSGREEYPSGSGIPCTVDNLVINKSISGLIIRLGEKSALIDNTAKRKITTACLNI
jgi:hypothetical protein